MTREEADALTSPIAPWAPALEPGGKAMILASAAGNRDTILESAAGGGVAPLALATSGGVASSRRH
jgi:hypothetical protein